MEALRCIRSAVARVVLCRVEESPGDVMHAPGNGGRGGVTALVHVSEVFQTLQRIRIDTAGFRVGRTGGAFEDSA